MVVAELVLTLLSGIAIVAVVLLGQRQPGPVYGAWSIALLLVLTGLTAVSVGWSVQPNASFEDTGRMLTYAGVFAAAVVLARAAPRRWPALLGGVTLAAVVVCAYGLATKIFPATLAPNVTYARLEEPFGYWNAIGLTAAMGAIGCMWLGARRRGHALLSALAYPGMGLTLLTLALAYSRGALAALAVGLVAWFALVPLRLRGSAVLLCGGVAAGAVTAWDFSKSALSSEGVALPFRSNAGHQLGVLVLVMLAVLTVAGVTAHFTTARRAPTALTRRRAGATLLALVAAAIVAFAGALAVSHRGFTGSISHAVSALTNPNTKPPPNTPGRLTGVASVRARYWKEALEVFEAHPALGAGAMGYQTARLRYRTAPLVVAQAHGFVVQTMADLGAVGLAIALALLACFLAAAGRATHPFNRAWAPWRSWRRIRDPRAARPGWRALPPRARSYDAERIGLLSMLCIVIVFGAHSLVDWTWYVPGDAIVALMCAGWLAGRGPRVAARAPRRSDSASVTERRAPRRLPRAPAVGWAGIMTAAVVAAAALLAGWSEWQPQRSEDARQQALELAAAHPQRALSAARTAVSRDPLSAFGLFTLAQVQTIAGETATARATLQKAVREQPSNPQTWLALGRFDLARNPKAAVRELGATIYLDPESISPELLARGDREAVTLHNEYIEALQAAAAPAPVPAAAAALTSGRGLHGRAGRAAHPARRPRPGP